MTRQEAEKKGRRAELVASLLLWCKGWRIVARRARTARGEIDLVARRGRTVAFVEVKMRSSKAGLDIAIDEWRFRRVAAAAEVLAARYCRHGENARLDLILVAPWRWPRHVTNIWHG